MELGCRILDKFFIGNNKEIDLKHFKLIFKTHFDHQTVKNLQLNYLYF